MLVVDALDYQRYDYKLVVIDPGQRLGDYKSRLRKLNKTNSESLEIKFFIASSP